MFPFFSKLCSQQPLSCYRNDLVTSTVIVKKPLYGPLYHWRLSCSIMREKVGQNLFFTGNVVFLSNFFCFQQAMSVRNDLITSSISARIPCGTIYVVSWHFSYSIIREKNARIFFSQESLPLLSKIFCFQQTLECKRNDLIPCTIVAKISRGA